MSGTEQESGGGGELFNRPDNLRSDARLAARLISLGCISEEQAQALIRKGMTLAAKCGDNNPRGYAACMKILIECVKLEQREEELRQGNVEQHLHLHAEAKAEPERREPSREIDDPEYLEYVRHRLASGKGLSGGAGLLGDGRAVGTGEASALPRPLADGLGDGSADGDDADEFADE